MKSVYILDKILAIFFSTINTIEIEIEISQF